LNRPLHPFPSPLFNKLPSGLGPDGQAWTSPSGRLLEPSFDPKVSGPKGRVEDRMVTVRLHSLSLSKVEGSKVDLEMEKGKKGGEVRLDLSLPPPQKART